MQQQIDALKNILNNGKVSYSGRNGGTIALSGTTERYRPEDGVPLPTTKKVNHRTVAIELEWFLKGLTDNRWLNNLGVKIWDTWDVELMELDELLAHVEATDLLAYNRLINLGAYRECKHDSERLDVARPYVLEQGIKITTGALGPVYGQMFRAWPVKEGITVDQIAELDENLAKAPMSRRHVISLWNPALLPDESKSHVDNLADGKQVLPPCHMSQQVLIEELSVDEICKYNNLSHFSFVRLIGHLVSDKRVSVVTDAILDSDYFTLARCLEILDGHSVDFPTYANRAINGQYDVMQMSAQVSSLSIYLAVQLHMELSIDFRTSMLETLKSEGIKTHRVNLQFYMRSNDAPVGRPFNVFSYYLLKEIIANVHNFVPGDLIHNTGNAHIYSNQLEAVMTQLNREILPAPTMTWKRKLESIADFTHEDYEIVDYNPAAFISTPVSS